MVATVIGILKFIGLLSMFYTNNKYINVVLKHKINTKFDKDFLDKYEYYIAFITIINFVICVVSISVGFQPYIELIYIGKLFEILLLNSIKKEK